MFVKDSVTILNNFTFRIVRNSQFEEIVKVAIKRNELDLAKVQD